MPVSEVFNEDCMIGMARYPDKFFDLAIVDPPYGIGINMNMGRRKGQKAKHEVKDWDDSIPGADYFIELSRVSKNQIIWGGNYFPLPLTKSWIFWDKYVPDGLDFADGELAWTSFDKTLVKARIPYSGFNGRDIDNRIHPTQKPVKLYAWILNQFAEAGDKIIDTHLGSGSSRIASYKLGFDFWGWEKDKSYFDGQNERFNSSINEPLFNNPIQTKLL